MLNYAGMRKSKSEYGSNALDNISRIELKSQKREYDGDNVTVLNGAIEEYWNFVKYSINDVLLQYGIENKTNDLRKIFNQAIYGGTRFSKALKQSVYLKNVFAIDYLKRDIIPRNNKNVNYSVYYNEDAANEAMSLISKYDDISLGGALVADPMLNDDVGINIFGDPSNCFFAYCFDADFKAMYPNIKIVYNIAEDTQEGRLIIEDQIIEDENITGDPKFLRGGKFIEDYTTYDCAKIGTWLKLSRMTDYIEEFGNLQKKSKKPRISRRVK
jgi:hypothetical protein